MNVFNETFIAEKPIYYPTNWQTGKTAQQLYEQWKLTTQYFLLSNAVQSIVAGLWLCFVFVVCNGLKQMLRLYKLDDSQRQKIENKSYITKQSVISTIFVSCIAFSVTLTLCFLNQFTRNCLLKGFVLLITIYVCIRLYIIFRGQYNILKEKSKQYQKIKKEQEPN